MPLIKILIAAHSRTSNGLNTSSTSWDSGSSCEAISGTMRSIKTSDGSPERSDSQVFMNDLLCRISFTTCK